ncbi:MAG: hypothetical protein EA403_14580 [Spirochaetaceae bacterium]|nr:MAG: hypothetical protein EA403_14580 [Spirochaetaceae bacterium]
MKKTALMALLALVLAAPAAFADRGPFGLGIILGEPTGISAKLWLGDAHAIDAAFAWSFADEGSLYVHGNYLFHLHDLISVNTGRLPVYFGIGGKVNLRDDPQVSVRIPIGLNYLFDSVPLDAFLELAPGIGLFPSTKADFGAGIGIRYYFGGSGAL